MEVISVIKLKWDSGCISCWWDGNGTNANMRFFSTYVYIKLLYNSIQG